MLYETQVSMWDLDSALPRDAAINTIFFRDTGGAAGDPAAIAEDVAGVYAAKLRAVPIEVKVYDGEAAAPRAPLGSFRQNWGNTGSAGNVPRELALCLSFYGGFNRPSQRGRIYLPVYLLGGAVPGTRPGDPLISKVVSFATEPNSSFPDIGGADLEWVVWSRKTSTAHKVTAGWCDDEWDTVRSRGYRATGRQTFTREG